jgi:phage shock protein C
MEPKKLYRSNRNKMICGVCAGIGDYINLDPTVVRLLWIIFGVTGFGILAYILAAIVMPVSNDI